MNEFVCDDCLDGDHEACRREGGFLNDEAHITATDSDNRCGCHLSSHQLDNRPGSLRSTTRIM